MLRILSHVCDINVLYKGIIKTTGIILKIVFYQFIYHMTVTGKENVISETEKTLWKLVDPARYKVNMEDKQSKT